MTRYVSRGYARIPLYDRSGAVVDYALVDTEDYDLVSQYTWRRMKSTNAKTSYARRSWRDADGKIRHQFMHQLVMGAKGMDHADRNGLNNRRSNLRPANQSQQNANQGMYKNNTSGYTGVHWDKARSNWRAEVRKNGRHVWRKRFDDPEVAARARDHQALKYFGEFAVLNFPERTRHVCRKAA
jgi:hypothetical protein